MTTPENPLHEILRISVPEFKPLIPEYMLDSITDNSTKYIIEQISIMSQQSSWQTHKIMTIYDYTHEMNSKVVELDQFRNDLLVQMQVEESIENEKESGVALMKLDQKSKRRFYILTGLVFIGILYPVYLAFIDANGIGGIINSILKTP